MNYFGHACVAFEVNEDPAFVLGAMLPDLASMLRSKPVAVEPDIDAGMRFHEATDAVFHQCPTFVRLNARAADGLRQLGVRRGPTRAVAHVGTEMLLDAELVKDTKRLTGYGRALELGAKGAVCRWPTPEVADSFERLAHHLWTRGARAHAADPEHIVMRLERVLAGRVRLEPTTEELVLIEGWVRDFRTIVTGTEVAVLNEVRVGLTNNRSSSRFDF